MAQLQLFPSSVRSSFSVPVFPFCVLKYYCFQIAHLPRFRACWKLHCIFSENDPPPPRTFFKKTSKFGETATPKGWISSKFNHCLSSMQFIQQDLQLVVSSGLTLLTRSCEVSDPSRDRCCALPLLSTSALRLCRLCWVPILPCSAQPCGPCAWVEPLLLPPALLRNPSKCLSCMRSAKKNSYTSLWLKFISQER